MPCWEIDGHGEGGVGAAEHQQLLGVLRHRVLEAGMEAVDGAPAWYQRDGRRYSQRFSHTATAGPQSRAARHIRGGSRSAG